MARKIYLSRGRRLTREERSMIRIMYNRGLRMTHIAQRIDVATSTVSNVVRGFTGQNDRGSDWDEVSQAFMKEFLPKEAKQSRSTQTKSLGSSAQNPPKRPWRLPPPQPSRLPLVCKVEDEPCFAVLRTVRSFAPPEALAPIDSRSTKTAVEDRALPLDLDTFLRDLEHDMSGLTADLEAQGVATIEHLLAFAPWSEERLHELFKATLPDITVPQRFMLVHGLKKYA
ncbi:hypothetical protein J132_02602 [Termitomyces sp. J132]|nr:hypothetical protein J132_02602 [Termitomyces sp. J132]